MSYKSSLFYRDNKEISFDFYIEEISTNGSLLLLEKTERKSRLIKYFSKCISDFHNPVLITYSKEAQLK